MSERSSITELESGQINPLSSIEDLARDDWNGVSDCDGVSTRQSAAPGRNRSDAAAVDLPAPNSGEETPQNIVWIASYPKSGNTWVRIFLHNLFREMRGETEPQDINALHRFTSWEFGARRYEEVVGKPVSAFASDDVARARMEVQRRLAASRKGPILVKTHLAFGVDRGFPTINLSATRAAIYLVRNPLDVAISYAHHTGWSIDATIDHMSQPAFQTPNTDQGVTETMGSWSQHVASWLGIAQRPIYFVRYEDMVSDPLNTFSNMTKYLGIKSTTQMLYSCIEKSSFEKLQAQEKGKDFIEKPKTAKSFFRGGRIGQWREQLSREQIRLIVNSHAPVMQRMGYLPANIG